jgi:hypothetical protein
LRPVQGRAGIEGLLPEAGAREMNRQHILSKYSRLLIGLVSEGMDERNRLLCRGYIEKILEELCNELGVY